jgi:hypothetical protein
MAEQDNNTIKINKVWGGIISTLIAVLIALLGYVYANDKKIQEDRYHREQLFQQEMTRFMRAQNIWNLVLLDLIAESHPNAKERAFQIWGQYENMNTRGGRNK